jgi:hypothetical protein
MQLYLALALVRSHKHGGAYDVIFVDAISASIPILKLTGAKVPYPHPQLIEVGTFCHAPVHLSRSSLSVCRVSRVVCTTFRSCPIAISPIATCARTAVRFSSASIGFRSMFWRK